ncbi:MAG: ribulose-phosphate 3-epimerase, partial [Erysipelotrichaceae bacterium]|nr:ribulose-phosphate 3-epimerase [Erysipelotrichaceae bacterium]
DFRNQLEIINRKVDLIHFDVMDGHFVPNLSFGPDIFRTFRLNSDLFLDVHLMVDDPDFFSDVFIKAGADGITFHYEAFKNDYERIEMLKKLKSRYIRAGIAIKPDTPAKSLYPLLEYCDLVLVMSVEPGFGGQSFIASAYDKVRDLSAAREIDGHKYLIEVDGGINDRNAHRLYELGCDIVVAGSYIFKDDLSLNIDNISFYD